MRQRVVIALAICTRPSLIVADEPTTALDVAVQKQILLLIKKLVKVHQMSVLLITHDMGVIAETTDTISILRNGRQVESGETISVLGNPQDSYTQNLIAAVPRIDRKFKRFPNTETNMESDSKNPSIQSTIKEFARNWLLTDRQKFHDTDQPMINTKNLSVVFTSKTSLFGRKKEFQAVNNVGFSIKAGETLGLVGESGSGKSTIAKTIVGIHRASTGSIKYKNSKVEIYHKRDLKDPMRRSVQMIFQDPYASLNNRWKIYSILAEPLRFYKLLQNDISEEKVISAMIELVGLPSNSLYKYPHQFSEGQRQRIAIARALISRPEFLICDEPTSALDVTVQAIILNLIKDMQEQFNLSILFISHDLPVIRQMADKIAVMKNGQIVEQSPSEEFFASPQHPYSRSLLADMPSLNILGRPNLAAQLEQ